MISRLLFILFLLWSEESFSQSSFYSLNVLNASGDTIHFSSLQGKKVLLVNVSSLGVRNTQLAQLEALQQLYKDSGMVVIVFPSNDFGTETKSASELQNFYSSYHFLVAAKSIVKGTGKSAVYEWLAAQNSNGAVVGDYQKFLVDGQGQLVGIYSGMMPLFDKILIERLNHK